MIKTFQYRIYHIKIAGQAMQDELIDIIDSGMLSTEDMDNVLDMVRLKNFILKFNAISTTCETLEVFEQTSSASVSGN